MQPEKRNLLLRYDWMFKIETKKISKNYYIFIVNQQN